MKGENLMFEKICELPSVLEGNGHWVNRLNSDDKWIFVKVELVGELP